MIKINMKNYRIKYSSEFSEDTQYAFGDSCWYLLEIDRKTSEEKIIWSDEMQPEDAILPRDLKDLVIFLEEKTQRLNYLLSKLENTPSKDCQNILSDYQQKFQVREQK